MHLRPGGLARLASALESAPMPQQITATSKPPTPPMKPREHGTVLSIESARRRRSGRSPSGDIVRVLVVGSHALTRAGLRSLLEGDAGLAVVGEAANGCDGARLVCSTDPDVVLLDAGWFEPDPAAATRFLGGRVPVLLLTDCDVDDRLFAALGAGATGVLAKDSHPSELASAVRMIAGGWALLPPRTTRRLITDFVNTPFPPR
jgi:CheY-like chemotaxis protein